MAPMNSFLTFLSHTCFLGNKIRVWWLQHQSAGPQPFHANTHWCVDTCIYSAITCETSSLVPKTKYCVCSWVCVCVCIPERCGCMSVIVFVCRECCYGQVYVNESVCMPFECMVPTFYVMWACESLSASGSVCVCVCVCERATERESERENQWVVLCIHSVSGSHDSSSCCQITLQNHKVKAL